MSDESFENALPEGETDAELDAILLGAAPVTKTVTNQPVKAPAKRYPRPHNTAKAEVVDKLPPHSIECEQGVLSCILQNPACLPDAIERLKSDSGIFYDLRHQLIYSELLRMLDERLSVDLITLMQRLKDGGVLEQIGGISYLNQIQDIAPSAANLGFYADTVEDEAMRRRVIASCTEIIQKAGNAASSAMLAADLEKVLALQSEKQIVACLDGAQAGELMISDLQRRMELEGKLSGLDTGLPDLNYMTEGLQFGEQFIVGARPSQGKTALGLSIFKHCAFNGIPSLFISLEMSVESVMRRMLSMHTNIPLREVKRGNYTDSEFGKFASFKALCKKHPMHIIDGVSGMSIREISSVVRRKVVQHGIKLVVIDYIQKIKPSEKQEKKTYEIGDISGRLKALAVELDIALLTLAQLNRENTKEKGRTPRLSDLADSSQIERDADTVGLLHKQEDSTLLIIAKQRDGEVGLIRLYFNGTYTRFESYRPESDEK